MPAKKRKGKKKKQSKKNLRKKQVKKVKSAQTFQEKGSAVLAKKKVVSKKEAAHTLPIKEIKKGLTKDVIFAVGSIVVILALKFSGWGELLLIKLGVL